MKKPGKTAKPKKPKKPPPKLAGGPLTVHIHHHQHHRPRPQHPHHRRHPKAAPTVKHAKHHKRRTLALGEAVGCCVAEALAASLRLAGWPVGDEDVLALHEATGGSGDVGVSILAALEAAKAHGLAGIRPVSFGPATKTGGFLSLILGLELPGPHAVTVDGPGLWTWGEWHPWECFPRAVIEEAWAVRWPAWL